jgi:hypothetical protein
MLRATTDRKPSSAQRLTLPAVAVTTVTITAGLARCHAGPALDAAIMSVVLALAVDVVITAIHGSPEPSLRALHLLGMITRKNESANLGSNNVYVVLDSFIGADASARNTLPTGITIEWLVTFLAERAAANSATGLAQDTERGTAANAGDLSPQGGANH